jgi:hypothetical protein
LSDLERRVIADIGVGQGGIDSGPAILVRACPDHAAGPVAQVAVQAGEGAACADAQ